jgi:rhodanese-related sulfurtransferase
LAALRGQTRLHIVRVGASELYAKLGAATAPLVIDARPDAVFADADRLIASAFRQSPDRVESWARDLVADRSVTVYCVHGHEVSQSVSTVLRALGFNATYLEGGIEGWFELGLPTRRNLGSQPGKWITRERPKIDRIACPWLIRRFIDPRSQFLYVPTAKILAAAAALNATPYDVDGVEFTHEGDRCSFDTIIRVYDIRDAALDRLATIVRGAIHLVTISRRSAVACLRSRSASLPIFPTTTKCLRTAW